MDCLVDQRLLFAGHLSGVVRGPRFNGLLTFGDKPIRGTYRKLLSEQLRDAVKRIFIPIQ
jgi:hypothetical protein